MNPLRGLILLAAAVPGAAVKSRAAAHADGPPCIIDRLRGERARAIDARLTPLLRKIGSFEGVVRRDLSVPSVPQGAAKPAGR